MDDAELLLVLQVLRTNRLTNRTPKFIYGCYWLVTTCNDGRDVVDLYAFC